MTRRKHGDRLEQRARCDCPATRPSDVRDPRGAIGGAPATRATASHTPPAVPPRLSGGGKPKVSHRVLALGDRAAARERLDSELDKALRERLVRTGPDSAHYPAEWLCE